MVIEDKIYVFVGSMVLEDIEDVGVVRGNIFFVYFVIYRMGLKMDMDRFGQEVIPKILSINARPSYTFSIFCRPSTRDIAIPNSSSHHYSHKLLKFHRYINNLLNILLSESNFGYLVVRTPLYIYI